jgi:nicotinate dehydrogenase subunit A
MKGNFVELLLNGRQVTVEARPDTPLLYILRNDFGLNGPKFGCGLGECGACSVLVDGVAARACVLPLSAVAGRSVTTLEGLADGDRLHPVQRAFIEEQGTQCGYCLNGMIITLVALLGRDPRPDEATIRQALRYNLCRCGAHIEIIAAALRAVELAAEDRQDV